MTDQGVCNVIVQVDTEPEVRAEFLTLAKKNLDAFARRPGFISGTILISEESETIFQLLQWQSANDHQACLTDPAWEKEESARDLFRLAGKAKWLPAVYSIYAQVVKAPKRRREQTCETRL